MGLIHDPVILLADYSADQVASLVKLIINHGTGQRLKSGNRMILTTSRYFRDQSTVFFTTDSNSEIDNLSR